MDYNKSIHTLIPDIYKLVGGGHGITDVASSDMGANIARALKQSFTDDEQRKRGLRLSGLGPSCPSALWYKINTPDDAEPLPPWARIKYGYGHVLEHLLIGLAKSAGHEVTGEQDELVVDGIVGHRDCVIDGAIVDVKSASTLSFEKFRDKTISQSDDFGYLDQLDAYLVGSEHDNRVRIKDRAYLLVCDKTLGHLTLYEHFIRKSSIEERIRRYKRIVSLDKPPACECREEADGVGGNIALAFPATYNSFKYCCKPHIRTFLYAGGPRYLTKVVKRPKRRDGTLIPEVDKHGNFIYNVH